MNIKLKSGRYFLRESINATAPLNITGKKAIITTPNEVYVITDTLFTTEDYLVYKKKSDIAPFSLFVDEVGTPVPISESVDATTRVNRIDREIIGTYDKKAGIDIKIPIADDLKHLANLTFSSAFGYFDCGWSRVNFTINHSDNQYFYCTTFDYTNVNNYNYDITAYKKDIRYVIFNAEKDGKGIWYDKDNVYVPRSMSTVYLVQTYSITNKPTITIRSDFNISGIEFYNIGTISVISDNRNTCNIQHCTFRNSLNTVLSIQKKNGNDVEPVDISHCTFLNCSLLAGNIISLNSNFTEVTCINVSNCKLSRYPDATMTYKNCSAAIYANGNISIINNTIYNTCRDHLFLREGKILCKGNHIFNDEAFNRQRERNLSSDFGLIYCGNMFYSAPEKALSNTISKTTIEGNLLHGAEAYGGDARGIFIDDGRPDVKCIHNLIYDTQLYSIDSRIAKNFQGLSSMRNEITENILTNKYRLQVSEGVEDKDKAIASNNCLINFDSNNNDTKNIRQEEKDFSINLDAQTFILKKGRVNPSRKEINVLKRIPFWENIKNYL